MFFFFLQHVFPWDWKAAELGNFGLNVTTMYLTLMHKLGLIYDLREPSKDLVKRTIINHGTYNKQTNNRERERV
jgi:stearoyl-CoA desaturase (Delta-9 desaturase)